MADPYAMRMRMLVQTVFCACLAAGALAGPGFAVPVATAQDSGQDSARQRRQSGQNLPVREIERRVLPRMAGARYLGFDYDPNTAVYTFKFLRNGSVIWVDVEGSSGRILRRTGN